MALLRAGRQVAYVSDAGMPLVADPGADLVQACAAAGVPVVVIPGPSAVTAALALAGFGADQPLFAGYLHARPSNAVRPWRAWAPSLIPGCCMKPRIASASPWPRWPKSWSRSARWRFAGS